MAIRQGPATTLAVRCIAKNCLIVNSATAVALAMATQGVSPARPSAMASTNKSSPHPRVPLWRPPSLIRGSTIIGTETYAKPRLGCFRTPSWARSERKSGVSSSFLAERLRSLGAWRTRVARPLAATDLDQIRRSSSTGQPVGIEEWIVGTSARLGYSPPTPKRRGRPPKR